VSSVPRDDQICQALDCRGPSDGRRQVVSLPLNAEYDRGNPIERAGRGYEPPKAESARPPRKEMGSKSKSDKLVCRYCGSDDLAPSFIKRRDCRCRKCFSKRYGSAARARKAKVKK